MRFWDSSALVPLTIDERFSAVAIELAAGDRDHVVWWVTPIEVEAALARALRLQSLDEPTYRRGVETLSAFRAESFEVAPIEGVRREALRIVRLHDLRTADALQLAAALTWCSGEPAGHGFVSFDRRLRAAARAERFEVLPNEIPGGA